MSSGQLCKIVLLIIGLLVCSVFSQQSKINIAVLDLEPTSIPNADAQFLSDRLRSELFKTGAFQVVERDKMQEILNEQGFQLSGCTSVDCAVEAGQLLNVQQMIAGNIGKIEDLYSISVRLINVESGAIIKTATRDFRGKLSSVLTEVIPQIAADMAGGERQQQQIVIQSVAKDDDKDSRDSPKFTILAKGGMTGLIYTGQLNNAVSDARDEVNSAGQSNNVEVSDYPGHFDWGVELRYALSQRLNIKAGLSMINMLSKWELDAKNYSNADHVYDDIYLERSFGFMNFFAGVNYNLWFEPNRYALYGGLDIGNTTLSSEIYQEYKKSDVNYEYDDSYTYNTLTLKLTAGFQYYLSRSFSVAAELCGQYAPDYSPNEDIDFEYFPWEFEEAAFPAKISITGIQINIFLAVHL